jgi:hypothetical protein
MTGASTTSRYLFGSGAGSTHDFDAIRELQH